MQKSDQHLIQSLQQQDKKVIAELYDQYAPTLYGVVLKIVQSEAIAQDVLQDAFVKIWKYGPKYDSRKGSLFTWMLNIARNTAIDKTRTANFQQGKKIQELDPLVYNSMNMSSQPNTDQIGLKKMVEGLDEKYQSIIDLIYFKGYTHMEVMEELDLPLGTVKSRIRIALRELRKIFGEFKLVLVTASWQLIQYFGSF